MTNTMKEYTIFDLNELEFEFQAWQDKRAISKELHTALGNAIAAIKELHA